MEPLYYKDYTASELYNDLLLDSKNIFGLFDPTIDESALAMIFSSKEIKEYRVVFKDTELDELMEASPYLVDLTNARLFVENLHTSLSEGKGSNIFPILIKTDYDIAEMLEHCRSLMTVKFQDKEMYFRFADSRSLFSLIGTSPIREWRRIMGPASSLFVHTAKDKWCIVNNFDVKEYPHMPSKDLPMIEITEKNSKAFDKQAEITFSLRLVNSLKKRLPHLETTCSDALIQSRVMRAMSVAQGFGLMSLSALEQFTFWMFSFGPHFHRQMAIHTALSNGDSESEILDDLAEYTTDKDWQECSQLPQEWPNT